jgi:uncharacterized protein YbbC (DUF1343 family)
MVQTGLEVLFKKQTGLLRGKRLALAANPSSIDPRCRFITDLFGRQTDWKLISFFGPEHGLRGEMQDQEWCDTYRDPSTGLPVHSLYGSNLKPAPEMLEGIDSLVFDMQDVGSRYYTFIYTLSYIMEACRDQDVEVIVLDRPNPLNGVDVEGPVLEKGHESFVGRYPIAIRHAMTVGEFAAFINEQFVGCKLHVVPMEGWKREWFFEQTGLPWVLPSPNMPTADTAIVYPGMCLLEGTNVSEGRGTTRPFEIFGAPWIDADAFCRRMNTFGELTGVVFRPHWFRPTFNKHARQLCGGAQIHVTDRNSFRPVRTALYILHVLLAEYAEHFRWKEPPYEFVSDRLPIDVLLGNSWVREKLEQGGQPAQIEEAWGAMTEQFSKRKAQYHMYR